MKLIVIDCFSYLCVVIVLCIDHCESEFLNRGGTFFFPNILFMILLFALSSAVSLMSRT